MMKLNKSTRYALYAATELARAGPQEQVTAAGVAERYRVSRAMLAKVFQQLVRAGIAVGIRGTGGGYRLARAATAITVLDVIEAFEPAPARGGCLLEDGDRDGCDKADVCRIKRLFDEVDDVARGTFASVTLETLVGRPRPGMGLHLATGAT